MNDPGNWEMSMKELLLFTLFAPILVPFLQPKMHLSTAYVVKKIKTCKQNLDHNVGL